MLAHDTLARENAAMRAYLICRNFSVNDGMYPAGHNKGGVVQGLPVAIGTGRRTSAYVDEYGRGSGSSSNSSTSESSSPASSDNGKEMGERSRGGGLSRALAYGSGSRRM
ncbi:MAG: hypothetical protein M1836_002581 [Candelina mexicana]|nr:MAG: hypothetical protein M1836_002581 [Candelina mexicana]